MKRKLDFSGFAEKIKGCVVRFPMETAAGLLFFVVGCIYYGSKAYAGRPLSTFMAFFPMVITVVYVLNYFSRRAYFLSLPVMVALLALFVDSLGAFVDSPSYAYTILLTAFVLVSHRRTSGNRDFSRSAVRLVANALLSGIVGLLLYGAVGLIMLSAGYIFDVSVSPVMWHVMIFVAFVVVPLLFCSVQERNEQNGEELVGLSGFGNIVLNYILNPAIVVYTVILFVYFIKIAVDWELPKGNVAYMVLAFVAASFVGQMSQHVVRKPLFGWFYRHFTWIALPPLCLFWAGTAFRIREYGFTEPRVYLFAAGLLMTAFVLFLLSERLRSFRLMFLLSSCAIVLLTYIPFTSAKSIAVASQESRLRLLAAELNLLDGKGRLAGTEGFMPADSLQRVAANELNDVYCYLESRKDSADLVANFGENRLNMDEINAEVVKVYYFDLPDDIVIDTSGYGKMYANVVADSEGNMRVGDLEIRIPKRYFARYNDDFSRWESGEEVDSAEPFVYRSDSYMVVFKAMMFYKDGYEPVYKGITVFVK